MPLRTFRCRLSFIQTCLIIGFSHSVSGELDERKYPLMDGRGHACRVRGENFDHAGIITENTEKPCGIALAPPLYEFQIAQSFCVPRGVCIKNCGEEEPGCVYTGDCASQTCFKDANTGEPAQLTRITHTGHGSVVKTKSGKTSEKRKRTLSGVQIALPEGCVALGDKNVQISRVTENCNGTHLLVDTIKGLVPQCRTLCLGYGNPEMEINLVHFSCPYCYSVDFQRYNSSGQVCVPHEKCEEVCGPRGPGCVYSGTCKTQFCFSGIDSKKPARIDFTSARGEDFSITIDNTPNNSTPNVLKDPPVFGRMPFSIDSGPLPRESSSPKPQPNPTAPPPSPPAISDENESSSKLQDKDRENIWVWLGPLLGLVLAAMIGFAGTVLSAVIRNRPPPKGDQSSDEEGNMDHLR